MAYPFYARKRIATMQSTIARATNRNPSSMCYLLSSDYDLSNTVTIVASTPIVSVTIAQMPIVGPTR